MACKRSGVRLPLAPQGTMSLPKIGSTSLTPAVDTSSLRFCPVAPQRITDLGERAALGLAVLMGVNLQRHGQSRVAQDELGVAGRNPQVLVARMNVGLLGKHRVAMARARGGWGRRGRTAWWQRRGPLA